jgi:hypothetical protein
MSFGNPTSLRLGMAGHLGGKEYRLRGRSVLGETEDGEVYYWNEFNLQTSEGEPATLVYDETERSSQWRLFTQFTPEYPMTAGDAATKQVGDALNLTGEDVRVTFRGRSTVYHVEGEPPAGEAVGYVAEYFNATAGELMQVVSWTGEEVEFYQGVSLSPQIVRSAFGLASAPGEGRSRIFSSFSGSASDETYDGWKFALKAGLILLLFVFVFGRGCSGAGHYETAPVKKVSAIAPPLAVGDAGTLLNQKFQVTAHALVDIAEVGARWDRHEYELTDDRGRTAVLLCGDRPGGGDWIFAEPLYLMRPPTAAEAAAKQVGDLVEWEGFTGRVTEIFLVTVEQAEGEHLVDGPVGTVRYGFRVANQYGTLLVLWNEAGIQFFHGQALTPQKGAAGFAPKK